MTFAYVSFTSGQAGSTLLNQIENTLNAFNSEESKGAKIATTDMKGNSARGLIISTKSDAPNPLTLGTTWNYKEFDTGSDYEAMYQEATDFLNNDSSLTETQKYYSQMTMTNAASNTARLVIWYRNQK